MMQNPFIKFFVTTLIGGAVFLVPIGMIGYIGYQTVLIMMMIAEPMAKFFPVDSVGGIAMANLIAFAIVIGICFVAGLIARHTIAGGLVKKLDSVLINVPGYAMIRGIKSNFDTEETEKMRPVVLQLGTAQRIGLEIQRLEDGRSMVYLPSSPSVWSGITQVLPADQVTYLDIPVTKVVELTEKFGHGVEELLERREATGDDRSGSDDDH